MIQFTVTAGTTSLILPISIYDSSSTTGGKLTGLAYNTASLTAYYNRSGASGSATSISLATATKGTWATGGFVAIDGTNMPGDYELHIPNAAIASGAKSVMVQLKGAANMVPVNILIEITAVDLQDAVRGGMTALPNANAEASGGLYTRGTGAGQIAQDANGNVRVNVDTIKTQTVTCAAGVTVLASVGTASTSTAQTGDSYARIGTNGAGLTALGDTRIANLDAAVSTRSTYAGGAVASVTAAVTVGTNNDKTGYALSSAGVQAIWDALSSALTTVGSIGKRLVDYLTGDVFARIGAPVGASLSADVAAVKTETAAIKAKTDNLPASPAAVSDIPTATTIAGQVWDVTLSGHLTSGTTGNALNAAGAAGDPWSTALPGSYGAGTAGKIIGDNLNATVSSRSILDAAGVRTAVGLATANLDTQIATLATGSNLSTVNSNVNSIVAKLPSGNIGDATAANQTTIIGYIDTEVAAIKTQTDKLAFTGSYVNAQIKASDNIDFGALQKTSLNAATPSVTVSDKTGFALTSAYDPAKTASQFDYTSNNVKIDLTQTVNAVTGNPTTVGGMLYLIKQCAKNKLNFNKSSNVMVLYEDDAATAKFTYTMTDDASNATRGAGS